MATTPHPAWPPLPLADWRETYHLLHMGSQMAGKVRLALAPRTNHYWSVALRPTARGLATTATRYGARTFDVELDLVDHVFRLSSDDGSRREIPFIRQTVKTLHESFFSALADIGIRVKIWPMPVEVPDPVRFTQDSRGSYDREAAGRFLKVLSSSAAVFEEFRAEFLGKCSPVHFFWGSFDLCVTRFSGRRASPRPEADAVTRESYSHEVSSVGFWPGSAAFPKAAFYAYAAPEPRGFAEAKVRPAEASYDGNLHEFLLPYDDVRAADDPRGHLLEFLRSTYEPAAELGKWDREALERAKERT